ncbi:MerR family transcriptional regulator [Deinococcus roseus]|uniref:HTH merR-type domain-containing protein n=1 Tax=Deinococcus roseus TaxID=392414 RepID=A0ABQ2DAR9_9DEIO|nr:MerR family transcriptional regulator [Deinococcus roseus]GGJ51800.1 hypothetical protein GCM10008938_42330 [Deinococcus roseus]
MTQTLNQNPTDRTEVTFSIQQMCLVVGLPASTLRYYEDLGLLGVVPKNSSGHRRYQETHLHRLRFLQLLKNTGMPLEDMKRFALLDDAGASTAPERILMLRDHHLALQDKVTLLQEQLGHLAGKIQYYQQVCEKYGLPDPLREQADAPPPGL